ncbi:MAG TPA: hypothetical protein VK906_12035 [Egicoccus sp.]|nr:hypothetical protein [Egicoccus sp.]HSK23904.1 hypothetical protein [Egicoccus sp.]
MRVTPRPVAATLLPAALALGLAGCAEPSLPSEPEATDVEAPTETPTPEPERAELVAAVDELVLSLERARDLLLEAADEVGAPAGREAADGALAQLVVGLGDTEPEGRAVFPSVTSEERGGDGDADDALTLALTAASEAGGALGQAVADALRDPLAGDLGSWQRDPAGLVDLARQVGAEAGDLDAMDAAVRELPGEGTRAIAWAMLAADAPDGDDLAAYAERGGTHLDFAIEALQAALGDGAGT